MLGNVTSHSYNQSSFYINNDAVDMDFRVSSDTNTNMLFVDASTDRIGVGTASPTAALHILSKTNQEPLTIKATTNGAHYITNKNAAGTDVAYTGLGGGAAFVTGAVTDYGVRATANLLFGAGSSTERARIDSSGKVLVNRTGADGSAFLQVACSGAGGYGIGVASGSGATVYVMEFRNSNGVVGTITTAGSATAYNTSSDYRLKENVVYDWDATTRLKQLKPARFNFIVDADTTVDGFLAHEAQAVVPEAVHGTHNQVDDDGVAVMQGIDQSKLVPLLVKTILELEARITALENT